MVTTPLDVSAFRAHRFIDAPFSLGVVSAPLWNSEKSSFAGMLTVLDIIHLIQYYYRTADFEQASTDVETFRLESLRGLFSFISSVPAQAILKKKSYRN